MLCTLTEKTAPSFFTAPPASETTPLGLCNSSTIAAPEFFQKSKEGGTNFVTPTGRVYDFPPRVKWGRIASLQTLLAIPLVALWARNAIRRRSRRNQTQVIS